MTQPITTALSLLVCAACLPTAGCLKRTEKIMVHRDGRVSIALQYEGDPAEYDARDAMPNKTTWREVTYRTEIGDDGKETRFLTARQDFAPKAQLPESYAEPGDPDADLYTRFPTTLSIERRGDGTYYHFRRVYEPRRWAYVQYWHDLCINDDVKKITEKPIEELTRLEQIRLIKALVRIEAFKQIEFAKAALAGCEPDLPSERWLVARRALLRSYEEVGLFVDQYEPQPHSDGENNVSTIDSVIDRCGALLQEARDECYAQEGHRLLTNGYDALTNVLKGDAALGTARMHRFDLAYQRAKKEFEITDALGGHHFEICVTMPGSIVAHNADNDTDQGEVCWNFGGDAFRDRPVELMITSRVNDKG